MSQPTVSCFFPGTPQGRELADLLLPRLAARGCDVRERVLTPAEFASACWNDDVLIVDGTVDGDGGAPDVYGVASAPPMALDHVLVVARSPLPINFFGTRHGGAPPYPGRHDNAAIATWVDQQFDRLTLPRPGKGWIRMRSTMRDSTAATERRLNATGQVFFSYRAGRGDRERQARVEVLRRLADEVEAEDRTAFFYPPGALAWEDEMLPAARHWQLASIIDRRLAVADEMWVILTPDYLGSWWTQAELVTIAYRRASGARTPTVRVYDPVSGALTPEPPDLIPAITFRQRRRMARWYTNTDPMTMGPEALLPMRVMSQAPLLGRLRYFHDPVWSTEFWDDPLVTCPVRLRDVPGRIDVEEFLWPERQEGRYRISAGLHGDASAFACPGCGREIAVSPAPARYLWSPLRLGGRVAGGLTVVPVRRARHP
ncbi:hypothetical protein [Microbispora sp. H13382]|uniref:hypothetical protein n=1 Tax=Microbispora sp. H13382 TaxID=2729112 RepID=UPI0016041C41|nr:hypothetical protein [Microbispora sp. H13382]